MASIHEKQMVGQTSSSPCNAPHSVSTETSSPAADTALTESNLPAERLENDDDGNKPTGPKLGLLLASVFTSMFLVSLDRLIITTAVPKITDEFNSVSDIGWYASAYLLTSCASQLLFGKIYTVFDIKATFLASILVFEIGSVICGAAPTSTAFIIGRAIAGLGGAGIYSGAMVVIIHSIPLHKRPMYQGMFGAVFGISSITGPLLGGAFTTHVTWRWCFYINLPLGAAAMVAVVLLLHIPDQASTNQPLKSKLYQLDICGTSLLVPGSVCLLLALQWGGLTYDWNDGRIIALLTLAAALLFGFGCVQVFLPNTATLPPRILKQRSIVAGAFSSLCIGSQTMIFSYYLPVWFQAIQGVSAVQSGIHLLPMIISMVISSVVTGGLVRRIGYYTPFMIAGVCLVSVGAGLLTTLQVQTPKAHWIGYQILLGWGLGSVSQAPNMAAQTVLPKDKVAIGTSLMFFSQLLGGAIFVSVGQNVFENQLSHRLSSISGITPEMVQSNGATSLIDLSGSNRQDILVAYNTSLRYVFRLGLILACLSMVGAVAMEWRNVKKDQLPRRVDSQTSSTDEKK